MEIMKLRKRCYILCVLLIPFVGINAQNDSNLAALSISLGTNFIDNTGSQNPVNFLSDFDNMAFSRPIEVYVGYELNNKIELFLGTSLNRFKSGQNVDGIFITENVDYSAVDAGVRYFPRNFKIGRDSSIKPYAHLGIGTHNLIVNQPTVNSGIGMQYFINPMVGIYANGNAKFSLDQEFFQSNHFQYSIGIIFKPFNTDYNDCGLYRN